ncbi:copper resistance CopC family protein [Leucothrix pacifica]|nr:copper resistance CopC family protein [Leucothrix pacifica]
MKFLKTMMVASLLTLSASALAHTGIKSTYPANEQMLEAAPKQLTLNFGASVRLMKVILMDGEHKDLNIGFKPKAEAGTSFKIAVPEIEVGEYMVSWTTMGKDGHKMSGDFSFMVHGEGMSHDDGHGDDHETEQKDDHKDDDHGH